MTAGIWMRLRAEMRNGWRAWLSLALLLGVTAGGSISAAAGARRTASAYPRFLAAQNAFDAVTGGGAEADYESHVAAIKTHPAVKDWVESTIVGGEVTLPARRGLPERVQKFPDVVLIGEATGKYLYETNKAKVLRGRLADRSSAGETMIPFTYAERNDVRIGDVIEAGIGFDPNSFESLKKIRLEVVGLTAAPGDFEALGQTAFLSIYVTPALIRENQAIMPPRIPDLLAIGMHLHGGGAAASALKKHIESTYNIDVPFIEPVITNAVQKTMRLYVVALWLLATLIALAGLAIFGQALARQFVLESSEYPALRALGFGRRELVALGLIRAGMIGAFAAVLAGFTAFLASPFAPIGAARIAEPSPGFAFDGVALGIGSAATLLIVVLVAVVPAFTAARFSSSESALDAAPARLSRVVAVASRAAMSPPAVTGLRMALEPGRGRSAVPVRTTITAVAIAIAAVTATVIVGRSLDHLIKTPALTGFTYDAIIPDEDDSPMSSTERTKRLESFPFVDATTEGTGVNVEMGGVDSFLIGFRSGGAIGFSPISGRVPSDAKRGELPEVALGPATMRRLHLKPGQSVRINYSVEEVPRSVTAYVVGAVAIPALPWAATDPGEGAVMTIATIRSFAQGEGGCCFVRFKPGTDLLRARATLEASGFETFVRTQRADLVTLQRITALPLVLSIIFGVMALSAIAHVLVTAIRRRRRDLAILKTLGFVKRDLRHAIAWQASTIAVLSAAIGVPAGLLLGRWGWQAVADQFGAVPVAITPAIVAALFPAALVVANVVALLPARSAVRTQPAAILRED